MEVPHLGRSLRLNEHEHEKRIFDVLRSSFSSPLATENYSTSTGSTLRRTRTGESSLSVLQSRIYRYDCCESISHLSPFTHSTKLRNPMNSHSAYAKRFKLDKLTSDVFGPENPPKDWADASLLVPHESLRREMQHMMDSSDKLVELAKFNSMQPWQAIYFCEWYLDVFQPFVKEHHEVEEELYFTWLKTRADIPEKHLSKQHEELIEMLEEITYICRKIISKTGFQCKDEVEALRTKMHKFAMEMKEHMMEEERDIPPLAKKFFTESEEKKILNKIMRRSRPSDIRKFLPSLLFSVSEWSTPEYYMEFRKEIPGPVLHVMEKYYVPDFETSIKPKRDAPFLVEEPILSRKKCFGLSFCIPCIF
jgi:hemerythrin-like domain-containing protein